MIGFKFRVLYQDKITLARVGEIHTPHGIIHTPAFVPVGTQATVKSLTPNELTNLGVELFFVNTYHMFLRPGIQVIEKTGGLHRFMNWHHPLITDSGGFQIYSLARNKFFSTTKNNFPDSNDNKIPQLVKTDEEGVQFQSHWDGTKYKFSPELSMALQWQLGADIHIAFDYCTPYPVRHEVAQQSMERTHRWAKRSFAENSKLNVKNVKLMGKYQALYGVVQGSVFEDLRKLSAGFISQLDFDGIAIGGVSVGESKSQMRQVCDWVVPILPPNKPRHLLGVGEIDDIFDLVERGIDTFDCVQPTRLARMGHVFNISNINPPSGRENSKFTIDITKKIYAQDTQPLDDDCKCYTCTNFSRAYIHHLFRVKELLAYRLSTIHNIYFVMSLLEKIRSEIAQGTFLQFRKHFFRI